MAQIHHNSGTIANDGTGDALRKFSQDVESNTTELYNGKVDKDGTKVLSDNNFTDDYKDAIDNIVIVPQVQSDWSVTNNTDKAFINNKPDLSVFVTTTELGNALTALLDGVDTTGDTLNKLNEKILAITEFPIEPQIFTALSTGINQEFTIADGVIPRTVYKSRGLLYKNTEWEFTTPILKILVNTNTGNSIYVEF